MNEGKETLYREASILTPLELDGGGHIDILPGGKKFKPDAWMGRIQEESAPPTYSRLDIPIERGTVLPRGMTDASPSSAHVETPAAATTVELTPVHAIDLDQRMEDLDRQFKKFAESLTDEIGKIETAKDNVQEEKTVVEQGQAELKRQQADIALEQKLVAQKEEEITKREAVAASAKEELARKERELEARAKEREAPLTAQHPGAAREHEPSASVKIEHDKGADDAALDRDGRRMQKALRKAERILERSRRHVVREVEAANWLIRFVKEISKSHIDRIEKNAAERAVRVVERAKEKEEKGKKKGRGIVGPVCVSILRIVFFLPYIGFRNFTRFLNNVIKNVHETIQKAGNIGDVYGAAQVNAPVPVLDTVGDLFSAIF